MLFKPVSYDVNLGKSAQRWWCEFGKKYDHKKRQSKNPMMWAR